MAINGVENVSSGAATTYSTNQPTSTQNSVAPEQTLTNKAVEAAASADAGNLAKEKASQETMRKNLQSAVEQTQKFVSTANKDIQFKVDDRFDRMIVKVVDRETGEVVREIPSEEMLKMAQALEKLQGLLVKQEA